MNSLTSLNPSSNDRALLLESLSALLPPRFGDLVQMRDGEDSPAAPCTRGLAITFLEEALTAGHTIEKSNEEGPPEEWDGWIYIERPDRKFYLATIYAH